MKSTDKDQHRDLANADYMVWRVNKGKKNMRDNQITRAYNMRARQRPETRH